MDNFKIIYKILKALEKAMDLEMFDADCISHEILKISYARWEKIIIMLVENRYIEGVVITKTMAAYSKHIAQPIHPVITLKGLEYLNENSIMKKAAELAKGITNFIS